MQNPVTDNGQELDAGFVVEKAAGGFDVVLESRGGSAHGPRLNRNRDYAPALRLILERMGHRRMILCDIQIASTVALRKPEEQRRISPDGYPLPIELSKCGDPEALRLAIGRASAAYGRGESKSGGNPTKRLRLKISWPDAAGLDAEEIEQLLAKTSTWTEDPTDDPDELEERVRRLRVKVRKRRTPLEAPPGSKHVAKIKGKVTRHVRDPNVIVWVLLQSNGTCESCEKPAPFSKADGEPYLEVRHMKPLAEGGPDTIDNAIACCPNCHRELHYGTKRDRLRREIVGKVKRLKTTV